MSSVGLVLPDDISAKCMFLSSRSLVSSSIFKILATVQTQKNGSAPEALDAETAAIIQKIGTSLSFPAEAQAAQKVAACTSVSSILEIALQGEKESVQLYEQIANSTKNDEVRKIFTALQSEEQIHVQKLLEMLQGWA